MGPNSPNPHIQIRVVQDHIMERLLRLFKENQQKDMGIKIALWKSPRWKFHPHDYIGLVKLDSSLKLKKKKKFQWPESLNNDN